MIMTTRTIMITSIIKGLAMTDARALQDRLTLVQWLSPAFPLGSFAYSHGLEQVIADGIVTDAASLKDWLEDILQHGAGTADAVLLVHAQRGADVTDLARALYASAERAEESEAQGAAFAKTIVALGHDLVPGPLAPRVGEAAREVTLPAEEVSAIYLHAFASNLVFCAVRFVPLGQAEGQGVLAALHDTIMEVATRAGDTELDDIGQSVPLADIAAMQHEPRSPRIFKT